MLTVPHALMVQYNALLKEHGIATTAEYNKWLRYYLDFCEKYRICKENRECMHLFTEKLREKNQSEDQRRRAGHAISIFLKIGKDATGETATIKSTRDPKPATAVVSALAASEASPYVSSSHYSAAGYQVNSNSPEWDLLLSNLKICA